ncbi:MAG: tRNA lysidine(34) synthetase TilS [Verrucomicrobia bacterium]|nr:MAG: tRNA lysidine(34) synthetase TilS [Verrucomicrobiota bacterium]
MKNLLEHVEAAIRERKLFRRGERILVAVSGGVDSMVLLRALVALARGQDWKLTVAHFNHQLRGRASDGDELFVKRAATALGLRCLTERGAVKSIAKERGISIEMAARELRHKFLADAARQTGSRMIALAHHADDQVELFFLRLFRGAGGEGMAGMKWSNVSPANSNIKLVRPLLDVSKIEIEQAAREAKIKFRTDASNACRDILRNRIRHDLLPQLRRGFQPALDKAVLRVMDLVGEESEAVAALARQWLRARKPGAFARLSVAVQRRVIQLQLREGKLPEEFDGVEFLRCFPNREFNLDVARSVARDAAGRLHFRWLTKAGFKSGLKKIWLRAESGAAEFGGVKLNWRITKRVARGKIARQPGRELFEADRVGRKITLRHWQPGDRFQPIGMTRAVKLQDLFVNLKIPKARRHELVVAVAEGGEIFWVEGTRIGEAFKLTGATRRALIWRWWR